jgi:S-DNA-T family DNA segregation ATPase FtsK/SpoIIIE
LLTATVPAVPIPEEPDLRALPVGRREDGHDLAVGILGRHTLVAGVTGAGKGSVLQSIIRALGPLIRSRLVRLYGIDPKGGMELAAAGAEALYTQLVREDPEDQAELLESLVAEMHARARRLAGVTRLHTPTTDDPLVVLVIDELAALTSYRPRTKDARELYGRIDTATNLLLSQGRAVGIIVIAALQDPRKEVLPNRDLFPARIALRLIEAEATDMVLGRGARDLGADCSRIDPDTPGVAWIWCDGDPEPIRARFAYPTDDDIAHLAEHYRPLTAVADADAGEEGRAA